MENQMLREVRVTVDPRSGDITYHPAVLHGRQVDAIRWTCESGPFAIQFAERTPFASADDRSDPERGERGWVIEKKVRGDASPGGYRYVCAVCAEGRVFVDAGCPVIIIDI
jgi:hypothetical protein